MGETDPITSLAASPHTTTASLPHTNNWAPFATVTTHPTDSLKRVCALPHVSVSVSAAAAVVVVVVVPIAIALLFAHQIHTLLHKMFLQYELALAVCDYCLCEAVVELQFVLLQILCELFRMHADRVTTVVHIAAIAVVFVLLNENIPMKPLHLPLPSAAAVGFLRMSSFE